MTRTVPTARAEPRLLERARRVGWAMLVAALAAMTVARLAPAWREVAWSAAAALALLGLLAVVNVALVRSLYRQLGDAAERDHNM